MPESAVYRILDRPAVYRFVQWFLGPRGERDTTEGLQRAWRAQPDAKRVIDVGCGPASLLWRIGVQPIGLDVTESYSRAFRAAHSSLAITGSATELPLADGSVDAAWCLFVFHHLPDEAVRKALDELYRVVRPGGYVAVWDGVLPVSALRRPIAYAVRKADRGKFMRTEEHLRALLPTQSAWSVRREFYSLYGYERLEMYRQKP